MMASWCPKMMSMIQLPVYRLAPTSTRLPHHLYTLRIVDQYHLVPSMQYIFSATDSAPKLPTAQTSGRRPVFSSKISYQKQPPPEQTPPRCSSRCLFLLQRTQ